MPAAKKSLASGKKKTPTRSAPKRRRNHRTAADPWEASSEDIYVVKALVNKKWEDSVRVWKYEVEWEPADDGTVYPPACVEQTEAERFLGEDPAPMDTDVLTWWGANETRFPNLARMAAQFLGCPATSASAERIFSVAGRIYGDLSQGMKDETLEERMFAKVNTGKPVRVDCLEQQN